MNRYLLSGFRCCTYANPINTNLMKNLNAPIRAVLLLSAACLPFLSHAGRTGKVNTIQLISATENESVIRFNLKDFELKNINGSSSIISAENMTPILKQGAPNLPKFAVSVMIPDEANMAVKIVSSNFIDYPNTEIAPSKGNLKRDINPADVPYIKGPEYSSNAFYPGSLADLQSPYVLRDYRGQTVWVYPFQYNPVTKTLRVYSDITVKVYSTDDNGLNSIHRSAYPSSVCEDFKKIYEDHFINAKFNPMYTPVGEFGKMLIISYGSYMAAMQPFVDWKIRTGINVTMVDATTAGSTSSAIKTYITNAYNAGGLAFVLLVGDAAQVPTIASPNGDSDNSYAYIVGNDNYPDLLMGRFSSENVQHVTTQVDKIVQYEKFPQLNGTWYEKGVGIASNQGPGDDNEYDWQHERNIRTKLMAFTYTTVDELYDGSQGGSDASGNPTSAMLSTIVNSGVSVINYTGHGSQTSWVTTGFSNTSINALNNSDKYPFVWSVGCVNGDFNGLTCFAETWQRATDNNGGPAGALSTMASTINQSWDPPMEAQDEFNDLLTNSYTNNIKHTFGGISMNGCAKMNDTYGTQGVEMTDTWVLFGDPSVVVRTAKPTPLTATHVPQDYVGVTTIVVNCNTPGALVGLSINNVWLGAGIVGTNNQASITFPSIASACTVDVTVTAFNKMPYFGTIPILNGTSVNEIGGSVSLAAVYPNPVQQNGILAVTLTASENTSVDLFDAAGRKVLTIAEEQILDPGTHQFRFDVSGLDKGVYFCRIQAGAFDTMRKVIVSK